MDGVLALVLLLALVAGLLIMARQPTFWLGLVKVIIANLIPSLWKALKPRDFTPEQKDKIARNEDPLRKREKGW